MTARKYIPLMNVSFLNIWQAAVYGIGVCAEFGGAAFKPLVGGRFLGKIRCDGILYLWKYCISYLTKKTTLGANANFHI